jgi:tetratricopeptide (TPR) repeat protein
MTELFGLVTSNYIESAGRNEYINTIKKIGSLVLAVAMLCSLTGCKSSNYKEAEELLRTGNYEEALSVYESLELGGSYKDSAEKVLECKYQIACVAYNNMDYNQADGIYCELNDYKDSAEKALECKYQIAGIAYDNMDYTQAYDIYCKLNDYKDSVENSLKAGYALANLYAANDNFALAYTTFNKLGNYEKSQELAKKCASFMMGNASIGDTVFFGVYEQDGNEENGLEPIKWIVLAKNGDYTLLLSEYILEKTRI